MDHNDWQEFNYIIQVRDIGGRWMYRAYYEKLDIEKEIRDITKDISDGWLSTSGKAVSISIVGKDGTDIERCI